MKKKILNVIGFLCFGLILGILISSIFPINQTILNHETNESVSSQNSNEKPEYLKNIIGKWHASPEVGAGYNDCYTFAKDRSYIFEYSQFDGEKRIINYKGKWKIIHNNLLSLTITQKTVIEGGEFTKDTTSEVTDYVLSGGTQKVVKENPPKEIIYPLGDMEINKKFQYPLIMKIGGIQYWKLGSTGKEEIEF